MPDRSPLGALALGLTLGLVLGLSGCGAGDTGDGVVSGVSEVDDDGLHGAALTTPYILEPVTLTATSGAEKALRPDPDAALTMVFFGYSMCPDICQAVMADLASATARLDQTDAEQVRVWFVTTDPARDDPATLRDYLDRFDPDFEGFTGPLADIVEVAESVHVPIERGPRLPSGGYEVTHGTPILGILPDGTVPVVWTEGTSAAKLAEDVTRIVRDGVPALDQEG